AAGFSNCCKDGGWGQDVGLAKCNILRLVSAAI
ncbi:conjugal transfer protein TraN, partial [Escherichia coli]